MSDQTTAPSEATTGTPKSGESLTRRLLGGAVGRNLGLVIALLLLVAVGAITAGDRFWNFENFLTNIRFASIIGVISIGMTFVITAGGIDQFRPVLAHRIPGKGAQHQEENANDPQRFHGITGFRPG